MPPKARAVERETHGILVGDDVALSWFGREQGQLSKVGAGVQRDVGRPAVFVRACDRAALDYVEDVARIALVNDLLA
jgi:hypothetical protein